MKDFPTISDGIWTLRKFKTSDLPLVKEASQDEMIPWVTSVPLVFSSKKGADYIRRQWSRFEQGFGYSFAIARTETDQAFGSLYISMKDADEERVTLGYWVVKSGRGGGAAKTAVQMVTDFAKRQLGMMRVQLLVEPWNIGSIRTAEASGFEREGIMRGWRAVRGECKDFLMMANIAPLGPSVIVPRQFGSSENGMDK